MRASGTELRDAGIAQVMIGAEDWRSEVQLAFDFWLDNFAPTTFSLEQFREFAEANGLPEPHHPNAWGGLAKKVAHRIKPVGFTTSVRPQAHARVTRTYQRA